MFWQEGAIMKITSFEAIPFSVPLKTPIVFAHGSVSSADHVLIRIHTDEGIVGQSEAPAHPFTYGESQESIMKAVSAWFSPALVGLDPLEREIARDRTNWLVHNHAARAAVDMAVWDIIGQSLGRPVRMLLGGYTNSMPVAHILFATSAQGMVDEAVQAQERYGVTTFKVKVGKDTVADSAALLALRKALGDAVELYVDANRGWTADQAIRMLPVMIETGVTMLEEPSPALEPLGRRRVAAHSVIPILGDESVTRLGEVAREILDNHSQLISIKVARTGFTESGRIVGLCEGLGVGMVMGSQMDSTIGTLCSLAFGTAFRSTSRQAAELGYFLQLTDDLLTQPLVIKEGMLAAPDLPGVGIEIDEDKLRHYRIDKDS
jgi:L-alanine-DL-glutamate epimerase-like enolase superfamily enzyme